MIIFLESCKAGDFFRTSPWHSTLLLHQGPLSQVPISLPPTVDEAPNPASHPTHSLVFKLPVTVGA